MPTPQTPTAPIITVKRLPDALYQCCHEWNYVCVQVCAGTFWAWYHGCVSHWQLCAELCHASCHVSSLESIKIIKSPGKRSWPDQRMDTWALHTYTRCLKPGLEIFILTHGIYFQSKLAHMGDHCSFFFGLFWRMHDMYARGRGRGWIVGYNDTQ